MTINEARIALEDVVVAYGGISEEAEDQIWNIIESFGSSEYGRGSNDGYHERTKQEL